MNNFNPSRQHINLSRMSSLGSYEQDIDLDNAHIINDSNHSSRMMANRNGPRSHHIDLLSIPVFLLELLVLCGLAIVAYFIHFQFHLEPMISGFHCDDIAFRQHYTEDRLTRYFSQIEDQLTLSVLLACFPIMVIIFCELVNSLFGALKFRQIRALCAGCKLNSFTRRTIRFSGAFLLGFFMVAISCELLATYAGRLRPFFGQECPAAYDQCATIPAAPAIVSRGRNLAPSPSASNAPQASRLVASDRMAWHERPAAQMAAADEGPSNRQSGRIMQPPQLADRVLIERQWIDLSGQNLALICQYSRGTLLANQTAATMTTNLFSDQEQIDFKFDQLAKSWPSYPAAVFAYTCFFVACYLSYVGTARPFRITSCVLVMCLVLLAAIFNVHLVKLHYHHWDDVIAGSALALLVVVFVLYAYLNKFRDSHFYKKQKLASQ